MGQASLCRVGGCYQSPGGLGVLVSARAPLSDRWLLPWAVLRRRPEILFLPLAAIWIAINLGPWGFGVGYLDSFYLAFTYQKTDVIFPFTYAFAVATFLTLMWTGSRWTGLGFSRTFLIAGTVPFAGPGAFEIVYQESGRFVRPEAFVGGAVPYVMISFGTWVLLGLTGVGWWRLTWRWAFVLGYSVIGFAVWIAIGFPLVTTGTFTQFPVAYALNITLKASFFLVFTLPILEGMHFERARARGDQLGTSEPSSADRAASIEAPSGPNGETFEPASLIGSLNDPTDGRASNPCRPIRPSRARWVVTDLMVREINSC
jgi:hypothetical protein